MITPEGGSRVKLAGFGYYTWHAESVTFPISVMFPGGGEYAPVVETITQAAEEELCELLSAIEYNSCPFPTTAMRDVAVIQRGENDGADWIWAVSLTEFGDPEWVAIGGCDYTGWDCQSDLQWYAAVPS